jgi:hypothetical protein
MVNHLRVSERETERKRKKKKGRDGETVRGRRKLKQENASKLKNVHHK